MNQQEEEMTYLKPGPELDAKVAEARGWKIVDKSDKCILVNKGPGTGAVVWNGSTSISDSWELVEEMEELGRVDLMCRMKKVYQCAFICPDGSEETWADGKTASHAICLVYLKVKVFF